MLGLQERATVLLFIQPRGLNPASCTLHKPSTASFSQGRPPQSNLISGQGPTFLPWKGARAQSRSSSVPSLLPQDDGGGGDHTPPQFPQCSSVLVTCGPLTPCLTPGPHGPAAMFAESFQASGPISADSLGMTYAGRC